MLKLSPKYESACSYIFESARRLGGHAYFVGGCVRDALLGIESKDLDIEIYGIQPQELEKMLRAYSKVGSLAYALKKLWRLDSQRIRYRREHSTT